MKLPVYRATPNTALFCVAIVTAANLCVAPSLAQAASGTTGKKPANYAGEAVVVEKYETTYRYNSDGTGETDTMVRARVQNEAGVQQLSVLAFPYASATQKALFTEVVAHHADGTSTETPGTDAMEMPAPITQEAPLYSDLKTLQIPVRSLRPGDVLEYEVRIQLQDAEAPSQFWGSYLFPKGMVFLSEKLTLDVPSAKYVQQWSAKIQPTVSEQSGRRIYVWQTSQLNPTASEKKDAEETPAAKPVQPDVAWTTFHTWTEVGDWYRGLAASRAVANDAIRAQANEITRDAKTPEEQLQAIYSFVSERIRYVGIDFGVGRYQPHPAPEVLVTRYGDCKDKDTLFEALLKAKGFTAAPALIGVNLELVPGLPSPSLFNHVITAIELPSGRVWADTTPGVTPFQLLVAPLRDKQALLIPTAGAAHLERTPAKPPFPFTDSFAATAKLTREGDLSSHVDLAYRSDSEIFVRLIAVNLAPVQWDKGTQLLANAMGFSGTTSNSQFDHPENTTQPMHVSYDYSKKPFGDWNNFRIVALLPANPLPAAPDKEPTDDIDLGAPRTETAVSRIQLPAGFGADLPDAIHVKTAFATFDKTYRVENGELTIQRQIVVLEGKLPAKFWEDYKKFAEAISLGPEPWIQLTSTSTSGTGPQPPKPGENNPEAATLITEVQELEREGDWPPTLAKLDEAKKLNPNQPFLWSNYGYVAMIQGHRDEADRDFQHELSLYPKEVFVVRLYASFLMGTRDADKAQSVLQTYFDGDPSDPQIALMLAGLQSRKDLPGAIATLRKANAAKPGDINLQTGLADMLIRAGEKQEAAAVASKALSAAGDDPNLLNNGAYMLAEADGDLAVAEKSSRHSLEVQETKIAGEQVGEANQNSFSRTSLLVASWDTLGYILAREKKFEEALRYLEPAWNNDPSLTIGLHYGEALEGAGREADARHIYLLTQSPAQGHAGSRPDADELTADLNRLHLAAPKKPNGLPGPDPLQLARTFHVPLARACKGFESSTVRMQFASTGLPDVLPVSGAAVADPTVEKIRNLTFPRFVPENSKSTILRDAIFTCSASSSQGEVVLMPMGPIAAERASQ